MKAMKFRHFYGVFAVAIMATALLSAMPSRAQADYVESKYVLISAYIYKFTQFTTWPGDLKNNNFTVCVLGQDPFGSNLDPIKSRMVNDERITLEYLSDAQENLSRCNVLFVSTSEAGNLKNIFSALKGTPVLTMSDIPGFSNSGGMVEFKHEGGKVRVWVALSVTRVRGLSISSKLLSLANMDIR